MLRIFSSSIKKNPDLPQIAVLQTTESVYYGHPSLSVTAKSGPDMEHSWNKPALIFIVIDFCELQSDQFFLAFWNQKT